MLQIAICDTKRQDLDITECVVQEYWKRNARGIVYGVDSYENPKAFLQSGKKCDILITEIDMEEMSGFALRDQMAKMEIYKKTAIIYLTNDDQKIQKAFGRNVCSFLTKPMDLKKARESMQPIVDGLVEEYCLEAAGKRLDLRTVICITSADQYVIIKTTTEEILWREKMYRLEHLLPAHDFIRSHKHAIVNLRFVDHIDEKIHMLDGSDLPISRNVKKELLRRYKIYLNDSQE